MFKSFLVAAVLGTASVSARVVPLQHHPAKREIVDVPLVRRVPSSVAPAPVASQPVASQAPASQKPASQAPAPTPYSTPTYSCPAAKGSSFTDVSSISWIIGCNAQPDTATAYTTISDSNSSPTFNDCFSYCAENDGDSTGTCGAFYYNQGSV